MDTTRLFLICQEFITKQRISCVEDIYQTDRVIENAYKFIDDICEEVGYYKDPNEEEDE
jgi:hypothetical protein